MANYIPEKHYVGWRDKADDNNPLAFMTPWGEKSADKKRMATVDNWCGNSDKAVQRIFENKPMRGFELGGEVRRWRTSNVVWRIIDPRGFELEISSGNMAYIMAESIIVKGVIEDELQWVRDGADNYLLPTSSEQYKTYTKNTDVLKTGMKASELTTGDLVECATGEKGIYLGMYSLVSFLENDKIINVSRRHIIREDGDAKGRLSYVAKSTWKPFTVLEAGKEKAKDYSKEINDNIDSMYISNGNVRYVCSGKFDISAALESYKIVPWVFDDSLEDVSYRSKKAHFLFKYKDNIIESSVIINNYREPRAVDYYSNSCQSYTFDFVRNVAKKGKTYTFDSSGSRMWYYNQSERVNDSDYVTKAEKFNYCITVDGKEIIVR